MNFEGTQFCRWQATRPSEPQALWALSTWGAQSSGLEMCVWRVRELIPPPQHLAATLTPLPTLTYRLAGWPETLRPS